VENNIEGLKLYIREADKADVAEIVEIESGTFTDPWSLNGFNSAIESVNMNLFVCTDGNSIYGYFVLGMACDEGELLTIAVRPGYRGHGIGSIMIEELIRFSEENGIKQLFLEVRVSNDSARALYRKYGFIQAGIRKNFYRLPTEDAIIGRLEL
jgi:ribosomal-protein-alanine N-acetyltransferase